MMMMMNTDVDKHEDDDDYADVISISNLPALLTPPAPLLTPQTSPLPANQSTPTPSLPVKLAAGF